MKLKNIWLIIMFFVLSNCSLFKRKSKEVLEAKAPKASERIIYKAKNYIINPGEVIKVSFLDDQSLKNPILKCHKREVPTHVEEGTRIAFIAETYFSRGKPRTCSFGEAGGELQIVLRLNIGKLSYPAERLNVDKRRVFLAKKDLARVRKEQKHLNEIYASSPGNPYFSQAFKMPLKSKITSYYGTKRIFNNEKQTQHLGTDFRAAIGTPIYSTNSGRVVLARELFYTGNTVIIDHGLNIFTIYGHLSELKTIEGEYVPQNVLIGLAGRTGRVTGPHLHWGVKVNGHFINGKSLVLATGGKE